MASFIMLVGLPGAGKSACAQELAETRGCVLVSSDAIRKELYGEESTLGSQGEVFGTMLKRSTEALKREVDVVWDATDLSRKRRKGVIEQLPKHIEKCCMIIWAKYETCLQRNEERNRKVPPDVIKQMLSRFEVPYYDEGWDEIQCWYTSELYNQGKLFQTLEINHDSPWHKGTIAEHAWRVLNKVEELTPEELLDEKNVFQDLALWHDIGKPLVKGFVNSRGEYTLGEAHYYGHQNVSAYLYLGIEELTPWRLCNAYLINCHMLKFQKEGRRFQGLSDRFQKILTVFADMDKEGA